MSDKQTSQAFSERDPYFSDTSETRKRKHSDDTTKLRRKKAKQAKRVASAAEAALVQDDGNIDEQKQINRAVGRMDGTLFADLIARAVKRFEPELSLVEMEDLRISRMCSPEDTEYLLTLCNCRIHLHRHSHVAGGTDTRKYASLPRILYRTGAIRIC